MPRKDNSFKEYLFVDGYNIINFWEDLKQKANISLEEARKDLIEIMVEYHHFTGIEVIVVFDAHLVKNNMGQEYSYKGIDIVYTKELETADHYIESKLDELGRVKRIRVATSDWLEQQIVLSRGGTRISARELEMEIKRNKQVVDNRRKDLALKSDTELNSLDEKTLEILNKISKNL
ncbi:MAG TPA: NYN domain-containing protein [Tissierellaceae bacterium]